MVRTRNGLPKHCSWAPDRHGKRRVRFRKGGVSRYLTGIPWSEDFMRCYAAALEGTEPQPSKIGGSRTLPGSVNALCVSYYGSPNFRGLKASTAAVRRNIIESEIRSKHGDKPVARLERKHINDIIGAKNETPQAANNLLMVLKLLLNYAVEIGMIRSNPALGVKGYARRGEGFHAWGEADVAQFEAFYPVGTKERLALALLLYTGQRVSDVARMGQQHVKGEHIAIRQEKTDTPLMLKMHPKLVSILAAVPRNNLTFLVTEHGKPFTSASFGNWFRKRCNEAGLPQCSAHGLRKCAATRLADAGCSLHRIMAVTGHKSMSSVAPYTKRADQARLAREAFETQFRAERERNLPNSVPNSEKAMTAQGANLVVASPAGFEPATCGLEIRCCYPAELRGRDGEAFTPRSASSASAATAGFRRTACGSAAWGGVPAMAGLFSIRSFRSVRNWRNFAPP